MEERVKKPSNSAQRSAVKVAMSRVDTTDDDDNESDDGDDEDSARTETLALHTASGPCSQRRRFPKLRRWHTRCQQHNN